MGTTKALLVVDGMTMLERATQAFTDAGVQCVVTAGSGELLDPGSDAEDHVPQGPMAGIVSGWRFLRQQVEVPDLVVVLSCDLPAIPSLVVTELMQVSQRHQHGAVAHDGERRQPLVAAYQADALDQMDTAFQAGKRSVRRCLDEWDIGVCYFDSHLVLDADTPEDLSGFDVQWPAG